MLWPESISRIICVMEQLTQVYGNTCRNTILSDNSHQSTQTVSRDYRRHSNRRCSSLLFFVVHEFLFKCFAVIMRCLLMTYEAGAGTGFLRLPVARRNVNCTSRFFWWNWEHFTLNAFLYITAVQPRLACRLRPAATFVNYRYTYCKNFTVM